MRGEIHYTRAVLRLHLVLRASRSNTGVLSNLRCPDFSVDEIYRYGGRYREPRRYRFRRVPREFVLVSHPLATPVLSRGERLYLSRAKELDQQRRKILREKKWENAKFMKTRKRKETRIFQWSSSEKRDARYLSYPLSKFGPRSPSTFVRRVPCEMVGRYLPFSHVERCPQGGHLYVLRGSFDGLAGFAVPETDTKGEPQRTRMDAPLTWVRFYWPRRD